MTETISEQAEMIAEQIQGTCKSLQSMLETHELDGLDDNPEFCERLDDLVFECKTCSWWFEISEMSDDPEHDWECEGCADDA